MDSTGPFEGAGVGFFALERGLWGTEKISHCVLITHRGLASDRLPLTDYDLASDNFSGPQLLHLENKRSVVEKVKWENAPRKHSVKWSFLIIRQVIREQEQTFPDLPCLPLSPVPLNDPSHCTVNNTPSPIQSQLTLAAQSGKLSPVMACSLKFLHSQSGINDWDFSLAWGRESCQELWHFYQSSKLTEAYSHHTGIATKWGRIPDHSEASRDCLFKTLNFPLPRVGCWHLLPTHAS